jgi:hypothetical protein
MADPTGGTPEPTEDEFGTLGELIDSVVDKTSKAWAKSLADLLDLGADDSGVADPAKPPTNPTKKTVAEPVTAKRRISFL